MQLIYVPIVSAHWVTKYLGMGLRTLTAVVTACNDRRYRQFHRIRPRLVCLHRSSLRSTLIDRMERKIAAYKRERGIDSLVLLGCRSHDAFLQQMTLVYFWKY